MAWQRHGENGENSAAASRGMAKRSGVSIVMAASVIINGGSEMAWQRSRQYRAARAHEKKKA
jgi:hypothetical protein